MSNNNDSLFSINWETLVNLVAEMKKGEEVIQRWTLQDASLTFRNVLGEVMTLPVRGRAAHILVGDVVGYVFQVASDGDGGYDPAAAFEQEDGFNPECFEHQ